MDTIWQQSLFAGEKSKYPILVKHIEKAINAGKLTPGERLPPVRDLAYQLQITPGTVARAYATLRDAGLLEAGVGRGTYVRAISRSMLEPAFGCVSGEIGRSAQTKENADDLCDFRISYVPDMGQGRLISQSFGQLETRLSPSDYVQYPSRKRCLPTHALLLDRVLRNNDLGDVTPEDVVLTVGGQSAINAVFQAVFRDKNPVIVLDEVSYKGFDRAAWQNRAEVLHVPWDEEGPSTAALQQLAERHKIKLYCAMSAAANPTARPTSATRMAEIAKLARAYDFHILDDHCTVLWRAQIPCYRALVPERTWFTGSFSKFFSPALRIGYAVAAQGHRIALIRSAGGSYNQAVSHFSVAHLDALLRHQAFEAVCLNIRARFAEQLEIVREIFDPASIHYAFDAPFFWLHLNQNWRPARFCAAAQKEGILLLSSDEFSVAAGHAPNAVRIALDGRLSHARFKGAMQTLRKLLDEVSLDLVV